MSRLRDLTLSHSEGLWIMEMKLFGMSGAHCR
jgi:hypothetical protein